jgi:mono/diheme cytochrome c family protein
MKKSWLRSPCLFFFTMCAAACHPLSSPDIALAEKPAKALAFAQAACGGCHAVEANGISPNPDAPPFARIANQEELSVETLSSWLRDAHNYPEEMEFSLERSEVDDLVAYMIKLRKPSYRPSI